MKKKMMIPLMGLALATLAGCTDGGNVSPSSNTPTAATPYTQDLVGARGRDGESSLEQRGFTWIRTQKTDTDSYTYWQHKQSGQCISVRTSDGRYASIVNSPAFDCQKK
ncbi:MAG: hypothetical protein U9Q90_01080 [Campylobacterota bacterium]|nr:hypothetical protein [Campylobacterota bacterium]